MRVIKLDDWPWPVRILTTMAQNKANESVHAVTACHHLAWLLLEMPGIRVLIPDAKKLQSVDIAVQKGLLTTPRAGAKKALLSVQLEGILAGAGEKTIAAFLKGTLIVPELLALVDPIAAFLGHPEAEAICTKIATKETMEKIPAAFLSFYCARELKHRDLTARHGVLATLQALDKQCIQHQVDPITDAVAKMKSLVSSFPKGDGVTLNFTPRFIGAIAASCADASPGSVFFEQCVRGDDALAFAVEAKKDAAARLREKAAPQEASETKPD
jgi:hypothetical protein